MKSILSTDIHQAVELLKKGKLVAIPTETVYGLAANMWNEEAIKLVFSTKERPLTNPLIVHIASMEQLAEITTDIPEKINWLIKHFWPGPLTVLFPKKSNISDTITAGSPLVAVRMPNHRMTLELIKVCGFPLVAPSANPANQISPTTAQHVEKYFKNKIDMILDGGACSQGIESTIVSWEHDKVIIHREGSLSRERINSVLGGEFTENKQTKSITSPGQFTKHYAPNKPLYLCQNVNDFIDEFENKPVGIITFDQFPKGFNNAVVRILAPNQSYALAMKNLYKTLHELDELPVESILCEWIPNEFEGKGINDRLKRAATKILTP